MSAYDMVGSYMLTGRVMTLSALEALASKLSRQAVAAQPVAFAFRRGDVVVFRDSKMYSNQLMPQGTELLVLGMEHQKGHGRDAVRVVDLNHLHHHGWTYWPESLRLRDAPHATPHPAGKPLTDTGAMTDQQKICNACVDPHGDYVHTCEGYQRRLRLYLSPSPSPDKEPQPAGKPLTDEELERRYEQRKAALIESGVDAEQAHRSASEYRAGMQEARLRYLAPLPGRDAIMEAVGVILCDAAACNVEDNMRGKAILNIRKHAERVLAQSSSAGVGDLTTTNTDDAADLRQAIAINLQEARELVRRLRKAELRNALAAEMTAAGSPVTAANLYTLLQHSPTVEGLSSSGVYAAIEEAVRENPETFTDEEGNGTRVYGLASWKAQRVVTVDRAVDALASIARQNCSDHTPFMGPCVTCGRTDNPFVLPPPTEAAAKLRTALEAGHQKH